MRRNNKYLFLLAFLILIAFCVFFYFSSASLESSLVDEKFIDRKLDVDLMCGAIERLVAIRDDWGKFDYEAILRDIVESLDETSRTCNQLLDMDLNIIAARTPIFPHAPFVVTEYPSLVEAMLMNEYGECTIRFDKPGIPPHDVKVYYRWVPMDPLAENRLLVMAGVSRFTIDQDVIWLVAYGEAALIIVAAVFVLYAVIMTCRLGYIYNRREGENKWRPKISS